MEFNISQSVRREDVPDKIAGIAKYIGDYKFKDMLYARTLRSTEARAIIKNIVFPKLPDGYCIVDKGDVPGRNRVKIIDYDMPFFADGVVNYIGEPIALVVGKDKRVIESILSQIRVEYQRIEPILSVEDGLNAEKPIFGDNNCFSDYTISKGDMVSAKRRAKFVYEGEYETGYQEQFYLEPQGMIGVYEEGKVSIYGSIQCPYYVKNAVEECLGFEPYRVRIVQTTTGGGFGGKEDYPSLIGGQVACAALKTKKPVCLIFERNEDIEVTTKRHPSKIRLKSYIDENYRVLGMEGDIVLDAGAYSGLSSVVLQRAMFASAGVYNIENLVVRGRAVATNKVVSGAFRGFGAPQAFFAIEMHMEHIARELGIDPFEFKLSNILRQGDRSTTGGLYRDRILLPEMVNRVIKMSSLEEKKKAFKEKRKIGKLNGIGLSMFFHGGGFTGSGERDHIKGRVRLVKDDKGYVEILVSNVEMGQGAGTTLRKIAAKTLEVPLSKIIFNNPDTDRVPDSGPTVASRTTVIVGKLVQEASEKLKERWSEDRVEVEVQYKYPEGFYWDNDRFEGDAYTSYSWGVNAVEVEVDPTTCEVKINGVWAVFDIGSAIDERIVKGQIDGGIVQGLGYASIEVMEDRSGKIMQRKSTDYTIPTSMDVPEIKSELMCEPYGGGPFGAKALGELTLVGAAPAYALAIEDALGVKINKIPVRPEHLMEVVQNGK
ncbi:xanthine dehydrogenase family protein molybdopterin-binding subunit [Fonticella tunisiensis]|uniref:CO/xanthine dehydrogenase Mo-binding subunit n=1 Tax=Fonticella tunisiensis TaxID=1096341 RepID=A0A4R7KXI3_9CLOT|nr:xanthine dehydrogenase family protein molybdopterin-binding subunit [Fonticella tunisiensis]TDT63666.1 CO/xanthine dehydrogenase Mo-binding subunit [Fonticella tunisiensis]